MNTDIKTKCEKCGVETHILMRSILDGDLCEGCLSEARLQKVKEEPDFSSLTDEMLINKVIFAGNPMLKFVNELAKRGYEVSVFVTSDYTKPPTYKLYAKAKKGLETSSTDLKV